MLDLIAALVLVMAPERTEQTFHVDPLVSALRYERHLDQYVERVTKAHQNVTSDTTDYVPSAISTTPSPAQWAALRECESGDDYTIVSSNGLWYGAYQFTFSTWNAQGGVGLPNQASPAEQDMRALRLYQSAGASPWPVCGAALS